MLTIRNFTLTVEGRTLLEHAALEVGDTEKVALTGPSGSGKTALLQAIVGWLPFQAGSVALGDLELKPETLAEFRSRIAYIQQTPVLCEPTVREVLLYPYSFRANRRHPRPTPEVLKAILNQVNLPETLLEAAPAALSGGEKQRISVARSLLFEKKIFLTVEAASELDNRNSTRVTHIFLKMPQPLLAVSHDLEVLAQYDRIYVISNRQLIVRTPKEIKDAQTKY